MISIINILFLGLFLIATGLLIVVSLPTFGIKLIVIIIIISTLFIRQYIIGFLYFGESIMTFGINIWMPNFSQSKVRLFYLSLISRCINFQCFVIVFLKINMLVLRMSLVSVFIEMTKTITHKNSNHTFNYIQENLPNYIQIFLIFLIENHIIILTNKIKHNHSSPQSFIQLVVFTSLMQHL